MKAIKPLLTAALFVSLSLSSLHAQLGAPGLGGKAGLAGPRLSGAMSALFGDHQSFSASVEMQVGEGTGKTVLPGKLDLLEGKTRMEFSMSKASGGGIPAESLGALKAMGMDQMVMISRPDKKLTYMVYPGLQGYTDHAMSDEDAIPADPAKRAAKYKVETTDLGKETVDGHACLKQKAIVTDDQGKKLESLVWKAEDLKGFPVKMEFVQDKQTFRTLYKDVNLAKPDSKVFDVPTDFTRHESMQAMMQSAVMKQMGAGGLLGK